jgi:hypothetical protein
MNRQLHLERLHRGTHVRKLHELRWAGLPDGVFVLRGDHPEMVVDGHLTEWTTAGYRMRRARPATGTVAVLTPPATIAVLRAGYPVQIDDTAR